MNCAPLPEPINPKFESRNEWLVTGSWGLGAQSDC